MENKKWYVIVFNVMIGILFLPVLLIIWLCGKIQDKRKARKKAKASVQPRTRQNISFAMPYVQPDVPLNDEAFISRIDEFIGIQYTSLNGLTGKRIDRELVAEKNPELKSKILSFLQEHPIEQLLYGKRDRIDVLDSDHWELRFIFADPGLNRRVSGYGYTEDTRPFLHRLVSYLPDLQAAETWQRAVEERRRENS